PDVTKFHCPALKEFTLDGQIVLLRVRRVSLSWSAGERRQVDRAIGRRPAIVETGLSLFINEDRCDARIVDVEWSRPANAPQPCEARRLRDERGGDDGRRRYSCERISQLKRGRDCTTVERLHGERCRQRVLQDVLVGEALVVNTIAAAHNRLLVALHVPGEPDARRNIIVAAVCQRTVGNAGRARESGEILL